MSGMEGVRVDSYVELNKERGQVIDQTLLKLTRKSQTSEDGAVQLAVLEDWKYRYVSIEGTRALSPYYQVSYDTTYTLVRDPKKKAAWIVDAVEATPRGELK